jgi:hypothetical protein
LAVTTSGDLSLLVAVWPEMTAAAMKREDIHKLQDQSIRTNL